MWLFVLSDIKNYYNNYVKRQPIKGYLKKNKEISPC